MSKRTKRKHNSRKYGKLKGKRKLIKSGKDPRIFSEQLLTVSTDHLRDATKNKKWKPVPYLRCPWCDLKLTALLSPTKNEKGETIGFGIGGITRYLGALKPSLLNKNNSFDCPHCGLPTFVAVTNDVTGQGRILGVLRCLSRDLDVTGRKIEEKVEVAVEEKGGLTNIEETNDTKLPDDKNNCDAPDTEGIPGDIEDSGEKELSV